MRREGVVFIAVALFVAGCGGGGGEDPDAESHSGCEAAMADAAEVDEMQDTVEDLWPAFDECTSLDEFASAAEAYPDALDGIDPEEYVRTACQNDPGVRDSELCAALGE